MIRRSTVVYITILIVLAGVYYYMNTRERPSEITTTAEPAEEVRYLFEAGVPTGIFLEARSGKTVGMARTAENAWALTQPIEAAAEQAASEAAASQVATMRILEQIPNIDPAVVGLQEPEYILILKFKSGTERTINIGVVTPTDSGYYVQDSGGGDIYIVSKSAVESLLRLLDTPPYLETATTSPNPVVTPTPGLP